MKQTMSVYDFRDGFQRIDRDNFSYEGLGALFEYFEGYEESTGEEIEFDPIAFCCDFSEYPSAVECVVGYLSLEDYENLFDDLDEEEKEKTALEYLRDNTTVIEFDGGIIIQGF